MGKTKLLWLLLVIFNTMFLAAQQRDIGLGGILGSPTGISIKIWLPKQTTAVVGAISWAIGEKDVLHLHGDYLWHKYDLIVVESGKLPLYYGVGCRVRSEKKNKFGVRIPLGIEYIFQTAPIDIFFEIVPVLNLFPDTEFHFDGGLGARYFFK